MRIERRFVWVTVVLTITTRLSLARSRPPTRPPGDYVTRFQLVFREDVSTTAPSRFNDEEGEPHIDGKLIVDGEVYASRGVEYMLRADDAGDRMRRFICTLVVEPPASCTTLLFP